MVAFFKFNYLLRGKNTVMDLCLNLKEQFFKNGFLDQQKKKRLGTLDVRKTKWKAIENGLKKGILPPSRAFDSILFF